MFLRALIAFLILPGVVAGLMPALLVSWDTWRSGGTNCGYVLVGLGLFLLLWCARDFFVSGRGTLAPWNPPKHLVVVGLYQFVRNPMYIAVLTLVLGWCLIAGSRLLAGYAAVLAVGFHLRVLYHEEPWLRRQFGDEWVAYSASVRRWLPRLSPLSYNQHTQPRAGANGHRPFRFRSRMKFESPDCSRELACRGHLKLKLVRERGFEPLRVTPLDPKSIMKVIPSKQKELQRNNKIERLSYFWECK